MAFSIDPIKLTELDIVNFLQWYEGFADSARYTRKIHGDSMLDGNDIEKLDNLTARLTKFIDSLKVENNKFLGVTWGTLAFLKRCSAETRKQFDDLKKEAEDLHLKFSKQGMPNVVTPFHYEIVRTIRSVPSNGLLRSEMSIFLRQAADIGVKFLDKSTPWYGWRKNNDTKGLVNAIDNARAVALAFDRVGDSAFVGKNTQTFKNFLALMSRVYIEASGLYGVQQVQEQAAAELHDKINNPLDKRNPTTGWFEALLFWGILAVCGFGLLKLVEVGVLLDKAKKL